MGYVIGSDRTEEGPQSEGMRPGRRVARGASRTPVGLCHAIEMETAVNDRGWLAVCGEHVAHRSDLSWPGGSFLEIERCAACIGAVDKEG